MEIFMFGFLSLPQKIIAGIIGILLLIGLFFSGKYIYDQSIRRTAQLEWNNTQLTQVVNELQEQKKAMEAFNESTRKLLEEVNKRNQELEERSRQLNDIINRAPDGQAPQVFRDLFKALGARP